MCICGARGGSGGSGATGGSGGRGATGAIAVPDATPGGDAVWAAAATDPTASAAIAPPIINLVMTPCLLLKIDCELNHSSLLAIERNRNDAHRATASMDGV